MRHVKGMAEGPISATIKDVAREAGVSIATVSRALSKPSRSSPKMVAHVRAVAERINYIPHRGAGSLVSRRFRTVGVIVPTIDNSIFAKAIHAMQNELNASGYMLVLASNSYDSRQEESALISLVQHGVDALALVGARHTGGVLRLLATKGLPFVNMWTYSPRAAYPSIGFDNRIAMRRVVEHLLALGHRDIGVISGITANNDRAAARVSGIRYGLKAHGCSLSDERFVEAEYTISDGRRAMRTLLSRSAEATAVICGNDILAFGAFYECAAQGIAVPESMSIAGFDDFELSQHLVPGLTTVRVPAEAIGVTVARYLLDYLAGRSVHQHVDLGTELIVRGSTTTPRPT